MSAIIYATSPLFDQLGCDRILPGIGELFVNINIHLAENVVKFTESTGHIVVNNANASMIFFINSEASQRDFREIDSPSRTTFIDIYMSAIT
jgi:hypothetical protein